MNSDLLEVRINRLKAKRDDWLKRNQFRAFHKHQIEVRTKPDFNGRTIIGAVCGCKKIWYIDLQ